MKAIKVSTDRGYLLKRMSAIGMLASGSVRDRASVDPALPKKGTAIKAAAAFALGSNFGNVRIGQESGPSALRRSGVDSGRYACHLV